MEACVKKTRPDDNKRTYIPYYLREVRWFLNRKKVCQNTSEIFPLLSSCAILVTINWQHVKNYQTNLLILSIFDIGRDVKKIILVYI